MFIQDFIAFMSLTVVGTALTAAIITNLVAITTIAVTCAAVPALKYITLPAEIRVTVLIMVLAISISFLVKKTRVS